MGSVKATMFKHTKAVQHLSQWVYTLGNPELTWALAVATGTIICYADVSLESDATPRARNRKIAEMWEDWFNAGYPDGEAHFGIHGVYEEFLQACPSGSEGAQILALEQAAAIGRGEVPTGSLARRQGRPNAAPPPTPVPAPVTPKLRLIEGGKYAGVQPGLR
jgi:hypothetical protein